MKKHEVRQDEKIYLIKVTLSDWYGHVRGMPYRVLAIPEGSTLYSLAEFILISFDFDFDHAFGFYDNIKRWTNSIEGYELFKDIDEDSEFKSVKRTMINKVFDKIGKKMLLLFDYGDEWHFVVELIGIEPYKDGMEYPSIVKFVGEAPPQYEEIDEEDEP